MNKKIALITEEFHPLLAEGLIDLGYEVIQEWTINTQGVIDKIPDIDLLIVNSKILVDKNLLSKATRLKVIIRIGSGLEIIDRETCKDMGIELISTPEGNANAVAEHTLAFILSSYNQLNKAQAELLDGKWLREANRGEELCGKTIGVIGCGNNGSRLVNLLAGFDTEVLVYDIVDIRYRISNVNARQTTMEEIYQKADLVSFHIPLNTSTSKMVDKTYLQKFNKNIDVINTSRGGICDEAALWTALTEGKIKRLMLDVFENEPLVLTDNLRGFVSANRLFMSPHIAGWTFESKQRMAEIALAKLKRGGFS